MEFVLSSSVQKKLIKKIKKAKKSTAQENTLGQWIGKIVSKGTDLVLNEITSEIAKEYSINVQTAHQQGKKSSYLKNTLGERKQIDHAIKNKDKFLIIVESKWLKDKRHLNDKGSWLLMMKDIAKANPTVKGIMTILAGPWEGVRSIINKRTIPIIYTLDEVYGLLTKEGINIPIDDERDAYATPEESLELYLDIVEEAAKDNIDFIGKLGYELINSKREKIKSSLEGLLVVDSKVAIDNIETVITSNHGHLIRKVHQDPSQAQQWLKSINSSFPSTVKEPEEQKEIFDN